MQKILMLDLAREQNPSRDHLFAYAALAQDSGYDALGLYLEHRFAFAATPWSHGLGAITPDQIRDLQSEFSSLQIIPFINLLGHMEGFIYTEEGKQYREQLLTGLQACPTHPGLADLAKAIVQETLETFTSDLIHIGGDETYQLNKCDRCQAATADLPEAQDPKAKLYADFFTPLLQQVIDAGRTPGIWGDMFIDHPTALAEIPKQTVIFDWQYMKGVKETAPLFQGFRVYGCPTLHVYNAPWLHLQGSEKNIREVSQDAHDLNLEGVCLTLWEGALFGAYDTLYPAIRWAAQAIDTPQTPKTILDAYAEESPDHRTWADLMGVQLEQIGGVFQFRQLRQPLKARLLLYSNPFLAWMHHADQLAGPDGEKALAICEQAMFQAPDEAAKNATIFVRAAVEFVCLADQTARLYADNKPDEAISRLVPLRYLFETLENTAKHNLDRIGSSRADIERCRQAKKHVETVIQRIRNYGHRELGYLPAFEILTNPRFTPHDQGNWWLINKWANE